MAGDKPLRFSSAIHRLRSIRAGFIRALDLEATDAVRGGFDERGFENYAEGLKADEPKRARPSGSFRNFPNFPNFSNWRNQ